METTNREKMMEATNRENLKRLLRGMEGQSRQVRDLAKISSGARQLAMETPPLRFTLSRVRQMATTLRLDQMARNIP